MFLCSRGKRYKSPHLGVSPYVLEPRGRQSVAVSRAAALCSYVLMFLCSRAKRLTRTLYLMFLCPYVLMSPALAATRQPISTHVFSLKKAVNTDFTGIIRLDYQHVYTH